MSNNFHFSGRVVQDLDLVERGTTKIAKVRLVRNEYAGNDENGRREREVAITFTAFDRMAESLAKNVMVGDQLIVHSRVRNNNYQTSDGQDRYDFNFEIVDYDYGAPGAAKRQALANRASEAR